MAPGRVAGLAFFAVCGLLGAALGVAGLSVYEMVRDTGAFEESRALIIAGDLRLLLLEAGTLIGFAAIVYLLAPQHRAEARDVQAAASEAE